MLDLLRQEPVIRLLPHLTESERDEITRARRARYGPQPGVDALASALERLTPEWKLS